MGNRLQHSLALWWWGLLGLNSRRVLFYQMETIIMSLQHCCKDQSLKIRALNRCLIARTRGIFTSVVIAKLSMDSPHPGGQDTWPFDVLCKSGVSSLFLFPSLPTTSLLSLMNPPSHIFWVDLVPLLVVNYIE